MINMNSEFVGMISDRIVNVSSAAGPTFVAKCGKEKQKILVKPKSWDQVEALIHEVDTLLDLPQDQAAEALEKAGYPPMYSSFAYGFSKACVNAHTRLFAAQHPQLKINAVTPGWIETGMTSIFIDKGKTGKDMGMKTPLDGAKIPVMLMMELVPTGVYFGSDGKKSPWDRYRGPGDPEYVEEEN